MTKGAAGAAGAAGGGGGTRARGAPGGIGTLAAATTSGSMIVRSRVCSAQYLLRASFIASVFMKSGDHCSTSSGLQTSSFCMRQGLRRRLAISTRSLEAGVSKRLLASSSERALSYATPMSSKLPINGPR